MFQDKEMHLSAEDQDLFRGNMLKAQQSGEFSDLFSNEDSDVLEIGSSEEAMDS